jgi:alpha-tubulin suppressor-like RCC1 family protein
LDVLTTLSIERIGIVFSTELMNLFLDSKPFNHSENVDFLISVINQFNVINIDYLGCNTLTSPSWREYYDTISETGVIVGASNDNTGNIKYGGDWVMESTSEDIEIIYFTESIEYYTYLLDTGEHMFAIKKDGTIWVNGMALFGELGLNNFETKLQLTSFTGDISGCTPKSISYGLYHTVMVMTDGTIWSAGRNNGGQLGNGTYGNTPDIEKNPTFKKITSDISGCSAKFVACGDAHTIILMTDNSLWGTGVNWAGHLGISNFTGVITSLTKMTSDISGCTPKYLSCGLNHTMVLMTNSTIWGTGQNQVGQLGLGTIGAGNNKDRLTRITSDISGCTPSRIECGGNHNVVLMTDGSLWANGYNFYGQLGLGTSGNGTEKGTLTKLISDISGCRPKSVACGLDHTVVLMTNGSLWTTGSNEYGQLGIGTNGIGTHKTTLTKMTSDISGCTPLEIACGAHYTLVLMTDNTIWATGRNNVGQLGINSTADKNTLQRMTTNNSNVVYMGEMFVPDSSMGFNCEVDIIGTYGATTSRITTPLINSRNINDTITMWPNIRSGSITAGSGMLSNAKLTFGNSVNTNTIGNFNFIANSLNTLSNTALNLFNSITNADVNLLSSITGTLQLGSSGTINIAPSLTSNFVSIGGVGNTGGLRIYNPITCGYTALAEPSATQIGYTTANLVSTATQTAPTANTLISLDFTVPTGIWLCIGAATHVSANNNNTIVSVGLNSSATFNNVNGMSTIHSSSLSSLIHNVSTVIKNLTNTGVTWKLLLMADKNDFQWNNCNVYLTRIA